MGKKIRDERDKKYCQKYVIVLFCYTYVAIHAFIFHINKNRKIVFIEMTNKKTTFKLTRKRLCHLYFYLTALNG